jgi:hypothetical protein
MFSRASPLYYKNNKRLKNAGVKIDFTEEQIRELMKCAEDPIYFIKKYVKIISLDRGLINFDLYEFQEDLIRIINDNRFVVAKIPRQMGKSTTVVSYLLWMIIFNPAYSVAVLANKASSARGVLRRLTRAYENLPFWLQQGIVEWNKSRIELENGSSVIADSTSGNAGRSGSYNCILLDEFAHVDRAIQHDFFQSVFPTTASGTTSKVIIISTTNGMEMFYKIWDEAIKKKSLPGKSVAFIPFEAHWSQHPDRDEQWKEIQLSKMTAEMFAQEFECEFLGAKNTLIPSHVIKKLIHITPISLEDGGNLRIYEIPKEKSIYVVTADSGEGVGEDFSALSVVDITQIPYKQVATYRNNNISTIEYPTVIESVARRYNNAWVLIEMNSIGKQVADILSDDLQYEYILKTGTKQSKGQEVTEGFGRNAATKIKLGVRTTTQVKLIGCKNFQTLVEKNNLIVQDFDTYSEITSFVRRGKGYAAQKGATDDLVMGLVLFSWFSTQKYFKEISGTNIQSSLVGENKRQQTENATPCIAVSSEYVDGSVSNQAQPYVADGCVWFPVNPQSD